MLPSLQQKKGAVIKMVRRELAKAVAEPRGEDGGGVVQEASTGVDFLSVPTRPTEWLVRLDESAAKHVFFFFYL